jgi:hypothetical protein
MNGASIQALTKPNEIRLTLPGKKWLTGASTPQCKVAIGILFLRSGVFFWTNRIRQGCCFRYLETKFGQ